jgi:FkbM family methyltransferase
MVECVVVDAGARYGLHPTWQSLEGVAEFHLFEMDEGEASRLIKKYESRPNIKVYATALYDSDSELTFRVSVHNALNSVFEANSSLLEDNAYMVEEFTQTEERSVSARSLDSLFRDRDVHFLKLDVEGAEYSVLTGAAATLDRAVLGVRCEVLFAPIYKGAKLFGQLHDLLAEHGFELLNLDYTGAGNKAGRFTLPGRYGKLLSSDAVWIANADKVWSSRAEDSHGNIVRYALFLLLNGASDLAVDALIRGTRERGLKLQALAGDPLVGVLRAKLLDLFKGLLSVPQLLQQEVTDTYLELFGEPFPVMHKFYEK